MAKPARSTKERGPRAALTRKLAAAPAAALMDLVLDYFANGPRLGPPVPDLDPSGARRRPATEVKGPWDMAYWEDRAELEAIEAAEESRQQAALADFACRVALLRRMEEEARADDATLLDLVRFDVRYLALPELANRVAWAKLNALSGRPADAGRGRRFLDKLAGVVRAVPRKAPKPGRVDFQMEHRHLVGTMRHVFTQQVLSAAAQHPGDQERQAGALERYYHEQKARPDLAVPNLATLIDACCPPLARDRALRALLARAFDALAFEVIEGRHGKAAAGLRATLFKPGWDAPYHEAGVQRDWSIVDRWWAKRESKPLVAEVLERARGTA